MIHRYFALLLITCGISQAEAQYAVRVASSDLTPSTVITHVRLPKPIPAAKVHHALVQQQGRMDRVRWIEAADREAARRRLIQRSSIVGRWDVVSKTQHAELRLSSDGFAITGAASSQKGVWQREANTGGFSLTLHSPNNAAAKFTAAWTVPGQQFRMVHQKTGAVYTVTKR